MKYISAARLTDCAVSLAYYIADLTVATTLFIAKKQYSNHVEIFQL